MKILKQTAMKMQRILTRLVTLIKKLYRKTVSFLAPLTTYVIRAFKQATFLLGGVYKGVVGLVVVLVLYAMTAEIPTGSMLFTTGSGDTMIFHQDNQIDFKFKEYTSDTVNITRTQQTESVVPPDSATAKMIRIGTLLVMLLTIIGWTTAQADRMKLMRVSKLNQRKDIKILVIENRGNFVVMQRDCGLIGLLIKQATTLDEALNSIHSNHITVIDVDGYDDVRDFIMKVKMCDSQIKIVVAGYEGIQGADEYISTPLTSKSLINILLKILNK